MPKVGMEPIRRRQLIEATISSIHDQGFQETTVKQISRRAGVSSGIIHHYFGGKDELLEATMRSLLEELRTHTVAGLSGAHSPRERLDAIIEANFSLQNFSRQTVSAWLSFWSEARRTPRLLRLQRVNQKRLSSNLLDALKQLMPVERAQITCEGLMALLDGLWLRAALSDTGLDKSRALAIANDYLECQLHAENTD